MGEESDIFNCQQCGYCCQGKTTVSLDDSDVTNMLAFLKMNRLNVKKRFLQVTGNVIQMKTVSGHCIFYDHGCTIHPGKPWRCSQWPLHPSIFIDQTNFDAIKASCPGINRELSYEEFCFRFSALLKNRKSGDNDNPPT